MSKLEFLLSEYEERMKIFEDSVERKIQQLSDASKRVAALEERKNSTRLSTSLDALKKILTDPAPEVTENYVRIRQKDPKQYIRLRTIKISAAKGIKAVVGFKKSGGSEIQSYLFDKNRWTIATAKKWIAAHKKADGLGVGGKPRKGKPKTNKERRKTHKARFGTSKLPKRGTGLSKYDSALIEKLSHVKQLASSKFNSALIDALRKMSPKIKKNVHLTDSIMVDEWTETPEGVTFHNVVFAREMVQKYPDGMHYKPASELKKGLDSLRGKPVTAYVHPSEKIVTSMKQQVGHIVFDRVFWDNRKNRSYGDVFIKKESKNKELIDAAKKKKLEDCSIGFRSDIVRQPGIFKGQHYDYVQKNFFIDHLAFAVPQGRASSSEGVGINAF